MKLLIFFNLLFFVYLCQSKKNYKNTKPGPSRNPSFSQSEQTQKLSTTSINQDNNNATNSKYQYLFINKTSIFNLTDRNFNNITLFGKGSRKWFIMFYASWCMYSREMMPIWRDLSKNYTGFVNFGMVDCDVQKHLKDRFLVRRYPTIVMISNGSFTEYKGVQDETSLRHFIDEGFVSHSFEHLPMEASLMKEIMRSWGKLTVLALVGMIILVGLCCICECFDKKEGEEEENEESDDDPNKEKKE